MFGKFAIFCLSICLFFPTLTAAQVKNAPVFRHEGSVLLSSDARFQFLSSTLLRMEYAEGGKFVNSSSVVVLKRSWPAVKVNAKEENGWLIAKTARLTLRYKLNSGRFTNENIKVEWKGGNWAYGDSDKNNLGGIVYSLDGVSKSKPPQFRPGLLSRNGYYLLDDSQSPLWNSDSSWIVPRVSRENQDLYIFVYGKDYTHVLKEYSVLCGKIPLIPRYTLGGWITDLNYEYLPGTEFIDKYKYTDEDVKKIAERFRTENIPLDVLVLDFAWHLYGWMGGYDWSPIFPNPGKFLDWSHKQGLKISLNDHPGYGTEAVLSNQDSHAALVRQRLGMIPPEGPKFSLDISKDWKFMTDPKDVGMENKWYSVGMNDSAWKTFHAGLKWEDEGYPDYDGIGWYRKIVALPADVVSDSLFLIIGGVDDEYDLFIDAVKVAHHGSTGNSVYNTTTVTDVKHYLKPGGKSLLALRVNDWGGGGGIVGSPVAISDKRPARGIRFNLADKLNAEVFMDVLHNPLIDQGVDFWWVDGGRGSCEMEGLNSQMWTNRIFYEYTEKHTKKRSFIFSRYGGHGNHRYPGFFTGDTYSDWEVLGFEVPATSLGGNVLMPYITHDIGGFLGRKISFDLYARWIQFGVFSPFLRLHSAFENPQDGNLRMPWMYGDKGIEYARKFFKMRYSLIPYIYTYCRRASDNAVPLVRPLYLEYPNNEESYRHPEEYFFGREMLASPVTDSLGVKDVYLPPGQWIGYFDGKKYKGDQKIRGQYSIETFPLFVRDGSIIVMQPDMDYTDQKPLDSLIVKVYGTRKARFDLYEDDGSSLDYREGSFAWTPLKYSGQKGEKSEVTIGPTKGIFKGQAEKRAYEIRLDRTSKPRSIKVNGKTLGVEIGGKEYWKWDERASELVLKIGQVDVRKALRVTIE